MAKSIKLSDAFAQAVEQALEQVFPDRQQIEVHTNEAAVRTLGIDDELDGGDVLPGFKLALRDIFKV